MLFVSTPAVPGRLRLRNAVLAMRDKGQHAAEESSVLQALRHTPPYGEAMHPACATDHTKCNMLRMDCLRVGNSMEAEVSLSG